VATVSAVQSISPPLSSALPAIPVTEGIHFLPSKYMWRFDSKRSFEGRVPVSAGDTVGRSSRREEDIRPEPAALGIGWTFR
jgi:hypothetical protein